MFRTSAFIRLGQLIDSILTERQAVFNELARLAFAENHWFTEENIRLALSAISEKMLRPENLDRWLEMYPSPAPSESKNVGIIMAGNIPLAGFFDLLCVCVCGHKAYIKTSSKDDVLMKYAVKALLNADRSLSIETLTDDSPLDAVIASGSNNSNRYFRSRYARIPHLLRGNRTSVAILTGHETAADLCGLSRDVFDYFGMGCRNVAKIVVPEGYNIQKLADALGEKNIVHPNYLHAYTHHKALLKMRGTDFIDGGFFTMREDAGFPESLPDLVFTRYSTLETVREWVSIHDETLQCVVTEAFDHPREVGFGQAQRPELWDYPDGKDVIAFLNNLQ